MIQAEVRFSKVDEVVAIQLMVLLPVQQLIQDMQLTEK
jgi:hypothetical protein